MTDDESTTQKDSSLWVAQINMPITYRFLLRKKLWLSCGDNELRINETCLGNQMAEEMSILIFSDAASHIQETWT
jgi:hypothetical protein